MSVAGLFAPAWQLATYGSLAPGESNHGQLAALRGAWFAGAVRGRLLRAGWDAGLGYPGIRLDTSGELVAAQLFVSADLPAHWRRLDAFEGEDYCRRLVAVFDPSGAGVIAVANIYQARAWS